MSEPIEVKLHLNKAHAAYPKETPEILADLAGENGDMARFRLTASWLRWSSPVKMTVQWCDTGPINISLPSCQITVFDKRLTSGYDL
ncbi:hypothetical protein H9L39_16047 [Fusarium oxysporum f. sp. albedinis]|nr:hypothetical protein H9L39_16047 [Fusarium oxysporum f. sp. albedinis]